MTPPDRLVPETLEEALAMIPQPQGLRALEKVADKISTEFHRITDAEDLISEFFLWLGEHPHHAKHWVYAGDDDKEHFGWKSFRRDSAGIMAKAARRDKNRALGLVEDDTVVYAKAQLADNLKWVWYGSHLIAEGSEEVKTSNTNDPALGGGKAAAIADVRDAYGKVVHPGSQWDMVLECLYCEGLSQREAAEKLGLNQSNVSRAHSRAIEALLQALNGTQSFYEGPGTREVLSNAQAIAKTHREED